MRIPKIVAAQRWQTWLLVTALLALSITALLVLDLSRHMRTTIIAEVERTLQMAVRELIEASGKIRPMPESVSRQALDGLLKAHSYEILRSYHDIEGGYLHNEEVIGHSFPTYTEPDSLLTQPENERAEVLAALRESQRTGRVAGRLLQDGQDLVIVAVSATHDSPVAAWALRRILNFSDSSELRRRLLLVAMMLIALASIGAVLRLSFSLQHGFAEIRSGLRKLERDPDFRIPDQDHELRSIVQAINTMAGKRQRLEAALRREDRLRAMGRMVAGIAHEIRNPLNSIRLTARVLARKLSVRDTAREQIDLITQEIDRLERLLKSLLVFRDETANPVWPQRVTPILERAVALVAPQARDRGVEIRVEALEGEAMISADDLQQAVVNLLLNAMDACGRGGIVTLRAAPHDNGYEILVDDTGPGLLPEQLERIFEVFYTTKPAGTGLGLAVTKAVLERMGASLEGMNHDGGARFVIRLRTQENHENENATAGG
ncbi:MAG: sensor histidine kinase [Bryobacteraceae bacterium]